MHRRFAGATLDAWSKLRHSVRVAVAMGRSVAKDAMRSKLPGTFLSLNHKCVGGVQDQPYTMSRKVAAVNAFASSLTSQLILGMARNEPDQLGNKRCFVTIGATAAFNSLVKTVLEPAFLHALEEAKYTQLRVQYGDEGQHIFNEKLERQGAGIKEEYGIDVSGFGFNKSGLEGEMKAAKGSSPANEGCVVSHAGSGSILDAMRISVPLVVVPNTDLLHNHQVQLAEVLAEQSYVVYGKIE